MIFPLRAPQRDNEWASARECPEASWEVANSTQMEVSNIILRAILDLLPEALNMITPWKHSGRRWWGLRWVYEPAAPASVWNWDKPVFRDLGSEHLHMHIWASFLDWACNVVLDSNVSECVCATQSSPRKKKKTPPLAGPLRILLVSDRALVGNVPSATTTTESLI